MHSADVQGQPVSRMPRPALAGAAAVVISIIVNAVIALAITALDPDGTRIGLAPIAYGTMTAIGVLAGTAGWAAVRRYAPRPRAVLRVLVPAVLALSFVPGVILLTTGTSPANVVGLWLMHLVVATVTVLVSRRIFPVPRESAPPAA